MFAALLADIVRSMFGIPLPDLPWWGWLVCALVAGTIFLSTGQSAGEKDKGCLRQLVNYTFGFLAIFSVIMGVLGLVEWVTTHGGWPRL